MTEKEFNSTYLSLAEACYRVAFYILESEADAEDALQELFLKLWKNRDSLDGIQNPKAYAMTLLRNLCLDRIRQVQKFEDAPLDERTVGICDADRELDQKERLEKVLAAVKSLPDKQRQVLILRTIKGLSYEEIAEKTGINYLALRVLLSRARQTLRQVL